MSLASVIADTWHELTPLWVAVRAIPSDEREGKGERERQTEREREGEEV